MENHTANQRAEQRHNAFATLNDLAEHVHKIDVLLRAAINTGAGEEDDAGWLMGLAQDEAVRLKARYMEWALAPRGERA